MRTSEGKGSVAVLVRLAKHEGGVLTSIVFGLVVCSSCANEPSTMAPYQCLVIFIDVDLLVDAGAIEEEMVNEDAAGV